MDGENPQVKGLMEFATEMARINIALYKSPASGTSYSQALDAGKVFKMLKALLKGRDRKGDAEVIDRIFTILNGGDIDGHRFTRTTSPNRPHWLATAQGIALFITLYDRVFANDMILGSWEDGGLHAKLVAGPGVPNNRVGRSGIPPIPYMYKCSMLYDEEQYEACAQALVDEGYEAARRDGRWTDANMNECGIPVAPHEEEAKKSDKYKSRDNDINISHGRGEMLLHDGLRRTRAATIEAKRVAHQEEKDRIEAAKQIRAENKKKKKTTAEQMKGLKEKNKAQAERIKTLQKQLKESKGTKGQAQQTSKGKGKGKGDDARKRCRTAESTSTTTPKKKPKVGKQKKEPTGPPETPPPNSSSSMSSSSSYPSTAISSIAQTPAAEPQPPALPGQAASQKRAPGKRQVRPRKR